MHQPLGFVDKFCDLIQFLSAHYEEGVSRGAATRWQMFAKQKRILYTGMN